MRGMCSNSDCGEFVEMTSDELAEFKEFLCPNHRPQEEAEEEEEPEESDEESEEETEEEEPEEEEEEGVFGCPECGCQRVEFKTTFSVSGYVKGKRTIAYDDDGDEHEDDDEFDDSDFEHTETHEAEVDHERGECESCGEKYDYNKWEHGKKKGD